MHLGGAQVAESEAALVKRLIDRKTEPMVSDSRPLPGVNTFPLLQACILSLGLMPPLPARHLLLATKMPRNKCAPKGECRHAW